MVESIHRAFTASPHTSVEATLEREAPQLLSVASEQAQALVVEAGHSEEARLGTP